MSNLLDQSLQDINKARKRYVVIAQCIRTIRAIMIGTIVLSIWMTVSPDAGSAALILGFFTFIMAMIFQAKTGSTEVKKDSFLLALDIKFPKATHPPYMLKSSSPTLAAAKEWEQHIESNLKDTKAFYKKHLKQILASIPIPILLLTLTIINEPVAISSAFKKVSNVIAVLHHSATMEIVSGSPTDEPMEKIVLSTNKFHEFELLMQNMIRIRVINKPQITPHIRLVKRPIGETKPLKEVTPYQSFRLPPEKGSGEENYQVYSIAFAIDQDTDIYLSTISKDKPVAFIKVRKLPVPEVSLKATGQKKRPWPDDKPFPLEIRANGKNPLKEIRLVIKAEGRTSVETVYNILAPDKKTVITDYKLLLDSYIQADQSQIEIIAEAVDRAIPIPLVGRSSPILVEAISAYERYQRTLQTLGELKKHVDEAVKDLKPKLHPDSNQLATKALNQAHESPFFDGLDRVTISSFKNKILSIKSKPTMVKALELQQAINEFLFEHESLDDRERDRDFFVATRSLSRLIETPKAKRSLTMAAMSERILNYLKARQKRWQLRVKNLESPPELWDTIKTAPFQKSIKKIRKLDASSTKTNRAKALTELSNAVALYRKWLDSLEGAEDAARKQQEQKRQQGLTNARNKLKEIQKAQDKISKALDRAAQRKHMELKENWPANRMKQNSNIGKTGSLEGQLRAMSPRASERIKAALEAMRYAVESGNKEAFSLAESGADMAGRLLRQAQSAARKSQRKSQRRQRRRRVTGDNYYGSQIIGRDIEIKRDYSVDSRYRGEILDDISRKRNLHKGSDDAKTLEDFLRNVIR